MERAQCVRCGAIFDDMQATWDRTVHSNPCPKCGAVGAIVSSPIIQPRGLGRIIHPSRLRVGAYNASRALRQYLRDEITGWMANVDWVTAVLVVAIAMLLVPLFILVPLADADFHLTRGLLLIMVISFGAFGYLWFKAAPLLLWSPYVLFFERQRPVGVAEYRQAMRDLSDSALAFAIASGPFSVYVLAEPTEFGPRSTVGATVIALMACCYATFAALARKRHDGFANVLVAVASSLFLIVGLWPAQWIIQWTRSPQFSICFLLLQVYFLTLSVHNIRLYRGLSDD